MMKKLGLGLLMVGMMLVGGVATMPVMAEVGDICEEMPDELKETIGCSLEKETTAMPLVINIINVALSIVALVAVGMIVYGAITFVISTGDAAKINRAKTTILYSIIGLGVALLSYGIVYYVSQSIWG